eukprot:5397528-Prymnesium_polylepis.1
MRFSLPIGFAIIGVLRERAPNVFQGHTTTIPTRPKKLTDALQGADRLKADLVAVSERNSSRHGQREAEGGMAG